MEIALLGDTHFGIYKSSQIFLNSQMRFFREMFIPYCKDVGIDTIVHAGDLFDNRNNINIKILNEVHKLFKEDLKDFKIYIIVGNHDTYFKNTIETHSLKMLGELSNITVIDNIQRHKIYNKDILMVPWQTDHDRFKSKVANQNIHCDVCIGHLETKGFFLNKGKVCDEGIDPELFLNNYTMTFSGHFHKRSRMNRGKNIIQYFGNCYHLTRHDIDEDRGFCILDLDNLEYKFINNNVSIRFEKIMYPEKILEEKVKGNVVDVHVNVTKNYDEKAFQGYLADIESLKPAFPANVKIENDFNLNTSADYKVQTVPELMNEYIQDLDIKYKDEISTRLIDLYNDSKSNI